MNHRSNTPTAPANEKPTSPSAPYRSRHVRTYRFEAQGVDPWAVLPLMQTIIEQVKRHSAGRLERTWPMECELVLHFESFEHSPTPEFGHPWSHQIDDELHIGFGWRCVKTITPDGDEIDEDAAQSERWDAEAIASLRAGAAPALRYVQVDGTAADVVEAIANEWDRDRGALISVKVEDRDGLRTVIRMDDGVTDEQLDDLVGRLRQVAKHIRVGREQNA